ncbi:MAG: hypothetical protein ABIH50_07735 [bacterium]
MNTMDNAKVMEVLEKNTLFNYFEKLVNAKMKKTILFPVFPITAAPILAEPRYLFIIENLDDLTRINSGSVNN